MSLFKKFYKPENAADFEITKRVGNQSQRDFVVSQTLQENKKYNKKVREFEEKVNASGINCEQYEELGFTFNGLVEPTLISESRKCVEHIEHPMLFKEVYGEKYHYVIKIPLDGSKSLPTTVRGLEDIRYNTLLERGRAQERAWLREKGEKYCKEHLEKYEDIVTKEVRDEKN